MLTTYIKKYAASMIVAASFLGLVFVVDAQTGSSANSSVSFKKDPASDLFAVTLKDPDGIRSFSLQAVDKGNYGGDLGKCPTLRVIDSVSFHDPGDFTPVMKVEITDCNDNVDELEVSPPKNGVGNGVRKSRVEEAPTGPSADVVKSSDVGERGKVVEQEKTEIIYPVSELNGCKSEAECRTYCDDSDNIKVCVDFAEAHGLMSREDAQRARKFADTAPDERPGDCSDETECTTYCEDSSRIDECIAFAEKYGFMPEDELAQAKKILPLIKSGGTPGGCKTKAQCELYCSEVSHIESCLKFAEENDLIPPEELAIAKKMVPLIKNGKTPGGCVSKIQCEAYCATPDHIRKCLEFGEEQGIIPPEELEQAKKILPLMERGEMPGGCMSKDSCEEYCSGEGHAEECIAFAEKAGFMTKEEAEMAKKTGGKGPGGCHSKEQCETYCKQNSEECMKWAKENGLEGELGGAGFSGPGGCTSEEECTKYCTENPDACKDFAPPGGGTMGGGSSGFAGPGGCKGQEECMAYCKDHQEECKNFMPHGGGTGGGFPGGGSTGGEFPGGGATSGNFPGGSGGFSGPGGCMSETECEAYCRAHPQECGGERPPQPPVPPSAQSCVPPPSGLVSWWNGDSSSDIAGGNNGSLSGSISMTDGKIGRGYKLDDGFIKVGNPASLNFGTGPFSLEAWFNWNGGGGTSANNIIRKSNYGPGPGSGYWLRVGNSSKPTLEFSVGATTGPEGQTLITAPVTIGAWYHAVGTKDASGNVKLYVDGQSIGTIVRQSPETDSTSESLFMIGAWDGFGTSEFFYGMIDEVSVYNRALSASEVQGIYYAKKGKCTAQPQESDLGAECTARAGMWDGKTCQSGGMGTPPQSFSPSSGGATVPPNGQIPQEYCSSFAQVPSCSYVGAPDSQNYKYCKQCYPDK